MSHPISKETHSVDNFEMSVSLRADETGVQRVHPHDYA